MKIARMIMNFKVVLQQGKDDCNIVSCPAFLDTTPKETAWMKPWRTSKSPWRAEEQTRLLGEAWGFNDDE